MLSTLFCYIRGLLVYNLMNEMKQNNMKQKSSRRDAFLTRPNDPLKKVKSNDLISLSVSSLFTLASKLN